MINSFLVEGKTKIIEKMNDENIIGVTKDFLTGGDAAKKKKLQILEFKTKQTSNVLAC